LGGSLDGAELRIQPVRERSRRGRHGQRCEVREQRARDGIARRLRRIAVALDAPGLHGLIRDEERQNVGDSLGACRRTIDSQNERHQDQEAPRHEPPFTTAAWITPLLSVTPSPETTRPFWTSPHEIPWNFVDLSVTTVCSKTLNCRFGHLPLTLVTVPAKCAVCPPGEGAGAGLGAGAGDGAGLGAGAGAGLGAGAGTGAGAGVGSGGGSACCVTV